MYMYISFYSLFMLSFPHTIQTVLTPDQSPAGHEALQCLQTLRDGDTHDVWDTQLYMYTGLTRSSPDSGSWDWSASCHIEGLYTAVLLLQTAVNHLQSIGTTHRLKGLAQFGSCTLTVSDEIDSPQTFPVCSSARNMDTAEIVGTLNAH